jgi:hypothetical protein
MSDRGLSKRSAKARGEGQKLKSQSQSDPRIDLDQTSGPTCCLGDQTSSDLTLTSLKSSENEFVCSSDPRRGHTEVQGAD